MTTFTPAQALAVATEAAKALLWSTKRGVNGENARAGLRWITRRETDPERAAADAEVFDLAVGYLVTKSGVPGARFADYLTPAYFERQQEFSRAVDAQAQTVVVPRIVAHLERYPAAYSDLTTVREQLKAAEYTVAWDFSIPEEETGEPEPVQD